MILSDPTYQTSHTNQNDGNYFLAVILICGCLLLISDLAISGEPSQIAVVVSRRIKPYVSIIEGMTEEPSKKEKKIEIFFLSDSSPQEDKEMASRLEAHRFDLFAAIGPEAAKLVWSLKTDRPKIFAAVLDPEILLEKGGSQCGVSLRIPVERQVQEISKAFANIKRIGLLFDANINDWFYKAAEAASGQYGISIVPLRVESRAQITEVLAKNWQNLDCVWMIPDQTVISEKIIEHIIKLSVYNSKGVIGFNSFFIRTGAFFAFDFDYRVLGIQTLKKMDAYLESGSCRPEAPEFQTLFNPKMIEKIGLKRKE